MGAPEERTRQHRHHDDGNEEPQISADRFHAMRPFSVMQTSGNDLPSAIVPKSLHSIPALWVWAVFIASHPSLM
jgi:hypothetical protein